MIDSQYFGLESYFNKNVTFYKNVNFYGDVNLDNIISKSISTKNLYVDGDVTISGSLTGSVNFKQQGVGAVNQTIQNKLHDLVSVKDFGAVGDGVTDDTLAIQSAINAHRRVFIPYGNYRITSAIVLSQGYSSLIGDRRKPTLTIASGNGPAVKIIANESILNEFSVIQDLILWCDGKPPYSTTPDSTNCGLAVDGSNASVSAAVQRATVRDCRIIGFSCGINLASHVNTWLKRIFIENHTNWAAETGYTSSNLYVGVNFNCTPFTLGGISPQASVEVDNVVVNLNGAPSAVTSQAFRVTGTDPRDIFFSDCESFGGDYGYWINPSSNDYNIDVHIRRPIIDAVERTGIHIENYAGYGALSIDGGYIVKSADNSGAAIWIDGSRGVTVNSMQLLGMALNTANDEGIRIRGSRAVTIGGCLIANCRYGISLDGAEFNTIYGNNVYADTGIFEAAPILSSGIRVFNGSGTNNVVANVIKGASTTYKYAEGISISSGCTNNTIVDNALDPLTITNTYVITDGTTNFRSNDTIQSSQQMLISKQAQQIYQGNDTTYPHLFKDGGGYNIAGVTNSGAWTSLSDITLKENINPLQYGVETIKNLSPVTYQLLSERHLAENNGTPCPTRLGFVAQEVQKYIPELISHMGEEQKLALEQTGIIPILVKAIQELDTRLQNIEISYPTT